MSRFIFAFAIVQVICVGGIRILANDDPFEMPRVSNYKWRPLDSIFLLNLLAECTSGHVSFSKARQMAEASYFDHDEDSAIAAELRLFASAGTFGAHTGHVKRDILGRFDNRWDTPDWLHVKVPIKRRHDKVIIEKEWPILMPSEVYTVVDRRFPLIGKHCIIGRPQDYWNSLNWQSPKWRHHPLKDEIEKGGCNS